MNIRIRLFLTTLLLAALSAQGLFLSACNDRPQASKTASMPKAPTPNIEARSEAGQLQIEVEIPPNHHAYLDSGKDENFIPLDFDWKDLANTGEPKPESRPKGEYDSEGKVYVLRGQARFTFRHPKAESLKGKKVGVRTQICDDNTGICYRPTTKDVTIQ